MTRTKKAEYRKYKRFEPDTQIKASLSMMSCKPRESAVIGEDIPLSKSFISSNTAKGLHSKYSLGIDKDCVILTIIQTAEYHGNIQKRIGRINQSRQFFAFPRLAMIADAIDKDLVELKQQCQDVIDAHYNPQSEETTRYKRQFKTLSTANTSVKIPINR